MTMASTSAAAVAAPTAKHGVHAAQASELLALGGVQALWLDDIAAEFQEKEQQRGGAAEPHAEAPYC